LKVPILRTRSTNRLNKRVRKNNHQIEINFLFILGICSLNPYPDQGFLVELGSTSKFLMTANKKNLQFEKKSKSFD
jgi:hypothetical protein